MTATWRWAVFTACAGLGVVGLVFGIVYLTEGATGAGGANLGWTGLFGVSAFLLWRRGGWRRAGVGFGLLMLGLVALYFVLVEFHSGGKWPFSV